MKVIGRRTPEMVDRRERGRHYGSVVGTAHLPAAAGVKRGTRKKRNRVSQSSNGCVVNNLVPVVADEDGIRKIMKGEEAQGNQEKPDKSHGVTMSNVNSASF